MNKEHPMRNDAKDAGGGGPHARRTRWTIAAAALAGTLCMHAPATAGNRGTAGAAREDSPTEPVRPKRWWVEPWTHSMQEVAFVSWMDTATKGTAWRWQMPVWQVEATYAWWLVNVWPFIEHGG